jgi:hypothetical protein
MIGMLLVATAMHGGTPYRVEATARPIASAPAYPAGMADDVRREGFNGRLWVTRPVMGGLNAAPNAAWPAPGPDAYGAYGQEGGVVRARVGHLVVPISPWTSWNKQGHRTLEDARSFWLAEQGYTGGVRTFVNDAVLFEAARRARAGAAIEEAPVAGPRPRAIIEIAPDAPRQRQRLRVDAGAAGAPALDARVSLPHIAPAELRARAGSYSGFAGQVIVAAR